MFKLMSFHASGIPDHIDDIIEKFVIRDIMVLNIKSEYFCKINSLFVKLIKSEYLILVFNK